MDIKEKRRRLNIMLERVLTKSYFNEFEVIDGLNQHPEGLTFDDWLNKILEDVND